MWRAVVVALVVCVAMPAIADDRKQADVHFKQGVAYFKAEQYDDAIAEFKKSYELDKQSKTLFNIANAYYKKSDYAGAVDYFQQYLAVDPDGPFAKQALEFSADAKRALAAEAVRKKTADDAAAAEQRRVAAASRIKQAEAFAQAGAWGSAGDEYLEAAEASGDPAHFISAAEAYRKQPALDKARDAYRAYLDKVPSGAQSDRVRAELAAVTSEIEKAQAAERVAAAKRPGDNEELARSVERVQRERDERDAAARRDLRTGFRVVGYLEPAWGGGGIPIDSTTVAPAGGTTGWTGPGFGGGIGVRHGLGSAVEMQARASASVYTTIFGANDVYCLSTSTLCASTMSPSVGGIFFLSIDATLRVRPSGWYVGLGPQLLFRATHAQGNIQTCGGSRCINGGQTTATAPFDTSANDVLFYGVLELGSVFGRDDRWDFGVRVTLGADTDTDGHVPPGPLRALGLALGYAFK